MGKCRDWGGACLGNCDDWGGAWLGNCDDWGGAGEMGMMQVAWLAVSWAQH